MAKKKSKKSKGSSKGLGKSRKMTSPVFEGLSGRKIASIVRKSRERKARFQALNPQIGQRMRVLMANVKQAGGWKLMSGDNKARFKAEMSNIMRSRNKMPVGSKNIKYYKTTPAKKRRTRLGPMTQKNFIKGYGPRQYAESQARAEQAAGIIENAVAVMDEVGAQEEIDLLEGRRGGKKVKYST